MTTALSKKAERLMLLTLGAVLFTHIVDFMIIMPLGPVLMHKFGIQPNQFSYLVSSYTIAAGLTSLVAMFFIDRFNRKPALLVVYGGFLLGTLACSLAGSYHILLAARVLTGAFGGLVNSIVLAIIGDTVPIQRRAQAMGATMASFSVASVVGVPAGLYFAAVAGWHMPFFLLVCLGALVVGTCLVTVPDLRHHLTAEESTEKASSFLHTLFRHHRDALWSLGLIMLITLSQFTVIPFVSPYMVANVGFSVKQLTYIYLLGGASTIISSPIIGRLADRFGRKPIFTIFTIASVLPIFAITHLGSVAMAVALIFTTTFFVVVSGRMVPAMTMVTASVPPRIRGGFMTLSGAVQQLSCGLAASISGAIILRNPQGHLLHFPRVGYIAIVAGLMSLLLAYKVRSAE